MRMCNEHGRSAAEATWPAPRAAVWTRRRLELPGGRTLEMPTLSKGVPEREGFTVIERRQPSLLAGG